MSRTNPLGTLNSMVIYQLKGLPYRDRLRLLVLSHLCGYDLKSSYDIPSSTVSELLEIYFPKWQESETLPPKDSQETIRAIAERCSEELIEQRGTPEEFHAKLEAEQNARHAIKEAAKAERIRQHEEKQRIKRERQAKKKTQEQLPVVLPTTRTRRIFG